MWLMRKRVQAIYYKVIKMDYVVPLILLACGYNYLPKLAKDLKYLANTSNHPEDELVHMIGNIRTSNGVGL